jgi:hypothetical protein
MVAGEAAVKPKFTTLKVTAATWVVLLESEACTLKL